jgi:tRNA G46 methylase TrmB
MPSRIITSNQDGLHPRLTEVVSRHLTAPFRKPIAEPSAAAFAEIKQVIADHGGSVILDAGCGVGESTQALGQMFPDHLILGLDRSAHRLTKATQRALHANVFLVRIDLIDFYRLARADGLQPERHYILYPNPTPKSEHLSRRWHGSPVFPDILELGGQLELRSNWKIYVEEFAKALEVTGYHSSTFNVDATTPMTPFERKYAASGQKLYGLICELGDTGTSPVEAR